MRLMGNEGINLDSLCRVACLEMTYDPKMAAISNATVREGVKAGGSVKTLVI